MDYEVAVNFKRPDGSISLNLTYAMFDAKSDAEAAEKAITIVLDIDPRYSAELIQLRRMGGDSIAELPPPTWFEIKKLVNHILISRAALLSNIESGREKLVCCNCRWGGLGTQLTTGNIDITGSTRVVIFLCPECDEPLAERHAEEALMPHPLNCVLVPNSKP